jgi:hypothetical protein
MLTSKSIVLAQGAAGAIGTDGIPMRVDPTVALPDVAHRQNPGKVEQESH